MATDLDFDDGPIQNEPGTAVSAVDQLLLGVEFSEAELALTQDEAVASAIERGVLFLEPVVEAQTLRFRGVVHEVLDSNQYYLLQPMRSVREVCAAVRAFIASGERVLLKPVTVSPEGGMRCFKIAVDVSRDSSFGNFWRGTEPVFEAQSN